MWRCGLREKQIVGAVEEREPWSWTKARESGKHREMHKENNSPKPLARKTREAEFCEFLRIFATIRAHRLEF